MIPNLVKIIFKDPIRTSKETQNFTTTKIRWLILLNIAEAVYSQNLIKPVDKMQRYRLLKQVVHNKHFLPLAELEGKTTESLICGRTGPGLQ